MTKEFAMLQASRQLEGYLSQERYGLNRMNANDNVSGEFLAVKVDHFNGLVTTLNHFFSSLTGIAEPLFDYYVTDETEDSFEVQLPSYVADMIGSKPADRQTTPPTDTGIASAMTELGVPVRMDDSIASAPSAEDVTEPEPEETPIWQLDGYPTYESWLSDKQAETEESRDDTAVAMNVGLSQHRADQILTEYSESAEQDIDTYVPEDDVPVSVLPGGETEVEDTGDPERPTRDLRYLSHTVDDTLIDTDPAQITKVETAVEREGVNGSRGPDIDIHSYSYQSEQSIVGDLINDDINKLRKVRADD